MEAAGPAPDGAAAAGPPHADEETFMPVGRLGETHKSIIVALGLKIVLEIFASILNDIFNYYDLEDKF